MCQRLCQLWLCGMIVLVGCKGETTSRVKVTIDAEGTTQTKEGASDKPAIHPVVGAVGDPPPPTSGNADEILPAIPEPSTQELYERALLDAVDHVANRDYAKALISLEQAQKLNDTGTVQREIYKVQAMLDQETGADKAVLDLKTILDDGKAEEASQLASAALGQYGGGDRADDLTKLKQEADALVTASFTSSTARRAALYKEADDALQSRNLRAAAVALEQALALGDDPIRSKQLSEVREKLATYDDCRSRASELRKDPTRVEEALSLLRQAKESWPTLLVEQEIDECELILERRRDRISVADFEVLSDVGVGEAGRVIAGELLPHFRPRFDLVERAQINRVLAELNLDADDLANNGIGREELRRSARLRYLVVGNLSSLGGVTLQARLVEVPTGLIVQTARMTAPTVEALVPKLKTVAMILQMDDQQKLAFEEALIQKVETVKPVEATDLVNVPPPPPPPVATQPPPPPIVPFTPRPAPLGGLVVEDFARIPVVVAPPPPPPALSVVMRAEDPRRNRLLRLSLELGDNCFRRGLFQEAQRHFQLAISIGGPRREFSLRLDSCRPHLPPPPPPPVVIVPPPVVVTPPPIVVVPAPPPPPPVVITRPPVIVARPRVAVFGWVCNCRPGLVPPAASETLADQFASYCRGTYEIIDRGEVSWYMGRLNLTMREVLNDPVSRRCLAEALNARYFVFGSLVETASFDVETHLVDPVSGTRTGTGKIHVQNQQELKLRMGELARQIGAKPDERKALAAQGVATEKTLAEARSLLTKDPAQAAKIARQGLKDNPDSVALRSIVAEADRRVNVAKLEADRKADAARQAKAMEQARRRQAELAKRAAEAKAKAEAEAQARTAAQRKAQASQREKAANALRSQARQALAQGRFAQAVQQFQSAANLQPNDAVMQELAGAKLAQEKAVANRQLAEQRKRDAELRQRWEKVAEQARAEKTRREQAEAERRKAEENRVRTLYDGFMKQANDEMAKKQYGKALSSAQSALRYRKTPEATKLIEEAREQAALASAESAQERRRLEEERRKREAAEKQLAQNQERYTNALKRAQNALTAKKYDEAISEYQAAAKLFDTDATKSGLATARQLREQQQKSMEAQRQAKLAESSRNARIKELIDEGKKLQTAKQHAKAIETFREALKLAPGNVDAVTGLNSAERARDAELVELNRSRAMKARQEAFNNHLTAGRQALAKKQLAEAEKQAREALKLAPNNPAAKQLLADSMAKPPAPTPSETTYKLAMQRASRLLTNKHFNEAAAAFDEALKAKPGDAEAIKGKRSALASAKPSTTPPQPKAMPNRSSYLQAMAAARAAVKSRKFGEAVKSFDEALKFQPNDPVATKERREAVLEGAYLSYLNRGNQALAKKQFTEAQKSFEAALKIKPKDPVATKGLQSATPPTPPSPKKNPPLPKGREEDYQLAMSAGVAAMKKQNFAGAVNAYNEALRLKPGDKAATAALTNARYSAALHQGDVAMKAKKFAEAIKAYDLALRVKPGDAVAIRKKKEAAAAAKR